MTKGQLHNPEMESLNVPYQQKQYNRLDSSMTKKALQIISSECDALEQFEFPSIFPRPTKKAYISFVTPEMLDGVRYTEIEFSPILYFTRLIKMDWVGFEPTTSALF